MYIHDYYFHLTKKKSFQISSCRSFLTLVYLLVAPPFPSLLLGSRPIGGSNPLHRETALISRVRPLSSTGLVRPVLSLEVALQGHLDLLRLLLDLVREQQRFWPVDPAGPRRRGCVRLRPHLPGPWLRPRSLGQFHHRLLVAALGAVVPRLGSGSCSSRSPNQS